MSGVEIATPAQRQHHGKQQPTGAVSRGYNVAHNWEQFAPLIDSQLAAIGLVAQSAADRPLPPH
eukprot:9188915-Pyramimonas_sp.AAC.1